MKLTLKMMQRFCAAVCVLIWNQGVAHAGYWELDRYVWSGDFDRRTVEWGERYLPGVLSEIIFDDSTHEGIVIPVSERARQIYPENHTARSDTKLEYNSGRDFAGRPRSPGVPAVGGSFFYRTRAVFRWHSETSSDLPPDYLFIREDAVLHSGENIHQWDGNAILHHTTASPYPGKRYQFSDMHSSVAELPRAVDTSTEQNSATSRSTHWGAAVITKVAAGANEVTGPTRTFSGFIRQNTTYVWDDFDQVGTANLSAQYTAEVANFGIFVRRKLSDARPTNLPFRSGGDQVASIAAGFRDTENEEHWLEVKATTNPPLANQPLFMQPDITKGKNRYIPENDWVWEPHPQSVTGADGTAIVGYYRSNDRTTLENFEMRFQRPPSPAGHPFAQFKQAWDEDYSSYYTNQPKHWEYGGTFDYGQNQAFDYDTDIDVTFKPSFIDRYDYGPYSSQPPLEEQVLVTNHVLNFLVGRIQVSGFLDGDTSSSSSYRRTWIFTSNPREVNPSPYSGPPILYAPQEDLDRYAVCTPRQGVTDTTEKGVYKTQLRISEPATDAFGDRIASFGDIIIKDASIEHVGLKAQDDEVYEPTP